MRCEALNRFLRRGVAEDLPDLVEWNFQLAKHADLSGLLDLQPAVEAIAICFVDGDGPQHSDGVVMAERLYRQAAKPSDLTDRQVVAHDENPSVRGPVAGESRAPGDYRSTRRAVRRRRSRRRRRCSTRARRGPARA